MDGCFRAVVEATKTAFALIEEDRTLVADLNIVAWADFGAGAATYTVVIDDVTLSFVVGYLGFAE